MSQTPTKTAPKSSRIAAALRSQDLPKPQLLFHHVPTNAENEPFKPLLEAKPHALVPYEQSLQLVKDQDTPRHHYPHPYQREIEQYEYPSFVYTHAEPIPYHPYESTTATFVDTEEALQDMLQELRGAKEIAIDLEHHDSRSYIGIVSLMQISTRDKDWIVDTLKPWRRKLQCLNEVFADPRILKVLHGAFMDIMWLQRDLGLYIVGLFDTHYAARALGYSGGSLAFLLKKFIDFDAQKQYQTADWRIRPLPTEMFEYARSDTHFLLYIYDNMRNELIEKSDFSVPNHEKDKINHVLVKSMETALQRYDHPIYDAERGLGPQGWYKLLSRTPALLTKQQFAVFRAVHQWRDKVAREQDDSVHYIMPNHNIFSIAKEMPTQKTSLYSIAQPISQTVRLRIDELIAVIRDAKIQGVNGPDMMATLKEIEVFIYGEPVASAALPSSQPGTTALPATSPSGPATNRTTSGDSKTQALKADTSLFWGSAFARSSNLNNQQRRSLTTDLSLNLRVPLPALTAEVFAENGSSIFETPAATTPKPAAAETSTPSKGAGEETDDGSKVFTLKELSRKRKSDVLSTPSTESHVSGGAEQAPQQSSNKNEGTATGNDGLAINADEVTLSTSDAERQGLKAAKRAAKRAKKEQQAQQRAEEELELEEEEEFDYANAPSVLHAAKAEEAERRRAARQQRGAAGAANKKGAATKKVFDPYKMATDTAKGLPRAQRERAGKSMTFKK